MDFDEFESIGSVGDIFNRQGIRLLPAKPKRKNIKNLSKYILWEKEVWKKNRKRCSNCGSKENLTIHHKKPVSEIISENKKVHINDISQLWDVENGVILCEACHKKIH